MHAIYCFLLSSRTTILDRTQVIQRGRFHNTLFMFVVKECTRISRYNYLFEKDTSYLKSIYLSISRFSSSNTNIPSNYLSKLSIILTFFIIIG